jgi:hypothetical protein
LQEIVLWRNQNLPGKEVWLTEFGWDTREGTPYSAIGHKLYPERIDAMELQALWLVRAYLAGAAAGIDRMFMFMLKDENGTGSFKSCGMIDLNDQPKTSWYYVATLSKALKGMYFKKEIPSGDPEVRIYQFSTRDNSRSTYVLWCPTSDGTLVNGYKFSIESSPMNAELVELAAGSTEGRMTLLTLTHGTAMIEVSESPVFILVSHTGNQGLENPDMKLGRIERE